MDEDKIFDIILEIIREREDVLNSSVYGENRLARIFGDLDYFYVNTPYFN